MYEIAHALAVLLAKDVHKPLRWPVLAAPVVVVLGTMAFLGMGLRSLDRLTIVPDSIPVLPELSLPLGGSASEDGATYSWIGIDTTDRSYIPDWARWNYCGYEEKAAYPEFQELVATMAELGEDPEHGCGRAMWEYESRARPVRHADGADAPAVLDRRVHRLDGGPLLRGVGHDAVPLPQPVRAVGRRRRTRSATCRTRASTSTSACSTCS